ncbi:hypothetical protein AZE42_11364, partial [Rhizopogon vesiculosus]
LLQRSQGVPSALRLDTTLPTLRERSVQWLLDGYRAINKPEIIKQAFASCHAGTLFNLSFESLSSRNALQRLRDVQRNEPDLWEQIVTRQYQLPEQRAVEEPPFTDNTDGADRSDVTVEAVAKHIADGNQDMPTGYSLDHDGSLITRNQSAVYESEITLDAQAEVSNTGEEAGVPHFGRGKRTRTANTLYNNFWSH